MVAVAGLELFRTNGNRFRIGAWRGDPDVGYLVPLESGRALSSTSIEGVVERLAQRGFDAVVTAALSPSEAKAFGSAGFSTIEELHLLSHPLDSIPQVDNHMALRPGRRWHRARMIEIDNRAFDAFWRFDSTSLSEAINATPPQTHQDRFDQPAPRICRDRRFLWRCLSSTSGCRPRVPRSGTRI
jgi:hypothetical protein